MGVSAFTGEGKLMIAFVAVANDLPKMSVTVWVSQHHRGRLSSFFHRADPRLCMWSPCLQEPSSCSS